ncbi:MAG: peptidyl-prolyl cis-trans isomerase [Pseudomonadota bacterium]
MSTRPLGPLLALLLVSCSKGPSPSGQESDAGANNRGALVARVGQVELREDDLKRAVARDPGASAQRFDSPQARRDLLDGLVRFELLVQAADRAGYTKDPDAIHALQQIAVTKLVNKTLGAAGSPETIAQADVEREYNARQASDFTLPEASQVRHILVSDPKLADRVAAQARALAPADDRAFATLAASTSEDVATRSTGGELDFIDKNSRLAPAVVEAALGLKAPGDVAGPIRTESGYEILRLVSRRAGAVSPFSSVQQQIRQRLYQERRAKALDAFIAKLRAETPVDIVDGGAIDGG